jgi:hypothetical protein
MPALWLDPAPALLPAATTEQPGAPRVDRVLLCFEARVRDTRDLLQRMQALLRWIRESHVGYDAEPFPFTPAMEAIAADEQIRAEAEVDEHLRMFREVRGSLQDARWCNFLWKREIDSSAMCAAVYAVGVQRKEWFADTKRRLGVLQRDVSAQLELVYCRCSNNWHYLRNVARALHERRAALAAVQALAPAPPYPLSAAPQELWESAFAG